MWISCLRFCIVQKLGSIQRENGKFPSLSTKDAEKDILHDKEIGLPNILTYGSLV